MPEETHMLEICVDTIDGLHTAAKAKVDRIELCSALALGGLTPSDGLCQAAARLDIPVYAMMRPRAGHFLYSPTEMEMIIKDIERVKAIGLAGIVFGAGDENGLHREQNMQVIQAAGDLGVTLHRVFDLKADEAELETAIALGFERILTSGGAKTALEGTGNLGKLAQIANGRIEIMAGSGVNADAIPKLAKAGITSFHASASRAVAPDPSLIEFGFSNGEERRTDPQKISELQHAIAALSSH